MTAGTGRGAPRSVGHALTSRRQLTSMRRRVHSIALSRNCHGSWPRKSSGTTPVNIANRRTLGSFKYCLHDPHTAVASAGTASRRAVTQQQGDR